MVGVFSVYSGLLPPPSDTLTQKNSIPKSVMTDLALRHNAVVTVLMRVCE